MGLILSLLMIFSGAMYADGGSIEFDESKSIVYVKYDAKDLSQYKVQVLKGAGKYNYDLYDGNEVFALQMGSGSYTVKVLEKVSGNKYRAVKSQSKYVKLAENQVYLQSIQNIDWSYKSKAVELAKELGLDKANSKEQFLAIYDEIVKKIDYDYHKASTVTNRYLPAIDETYAEKKGICYDYSSLMASMLRSLGIPTKMIHGYSSNTGSVYHAWNEVLINGEWVVVDSTTDAQSFRIGKTYESSKPSSDYKMEKHF